LDQNIPRPVLSWLRVQKPDWVVDHASEVGLAGKPDVDVFRWAQEHGAVIFTFDEDFADQRAYPVGKHHGVVRLRIWPTSIAETKNAIRMLIAEVPGEELAGALVIVGRTRIRIRSGR
jgi:predicted nuclease of predicted toxin-antitoxin system